MAQGCPADELIAAFGAGQLSGPEREVIATHVASCSRCGGQLGQVVQAVEANAPTWYDSPAAQRRRISAPSLPQAPSGTGANPSEGFDDTVASSGDRTEPNAVEGYGRGSQLARYVVIDRLGRGGMGEVYSAYDPDLDRKVAIKLLRPDMLASGAADELRVRLLREAQAMARLSHPAVVTVHDVGLVGSQVFIAMEFVDGQTLTQWLKTKRTWRQVLDVYLQAGRGLAAAHASGLTHRDFKPDNVVVSRDGRVRVMDFGLAHAHDETARHDSLTPALVPDSGSGAMKRRITQPGTMLGTPAYMSLEQLQGQPTDPRSDQFSFCVALYEGLYGARPFAGQTAPAVAVELSLNRVQPPPPNAGVPRRIRTLLLRGLRADPKERFRAMEPLLIGLSRRRSAVVRQWVAAGAALVVAITAAASVVQYRRVSQRCASIADRFQGVWDEPSRAATKQAFAATGKPWAERAFSDVRGRLDAYTRRWIELRMNVCTQHSAIDEQLGDQLLCLGRSHAEVSAVATLFARADADVVERAVPMVLALPSLELCLSSGPEAPQRASEPDEVMVALAGARALLEAGKPQEALSQASAIALAHRGAEAVVARAQLLAGQASARLGNLEAAERSLLDAVLTAEAARADEIAARAWTERVGVAGLRNSPEADGYARFASAALDRVRAGPELRASLVNNQGVVAGARGQYAEAAKAYQRAYELRRDSLGTKHPLVARALSNLGAALKAQGQPQDAVARYRQALQIEEEVLDGTHPQVADTLNNLGNALNEAGDRQGALKALRRSVQLKQVAWGPESLQAAVGLTNLGAVLLADGATAEARAALTLALQLKEKVAGPEALTVAITLTNLASLERAEGRPEQVLALAHRAADIRRQRQGPSHPELAFNLTQQGLAFLELGQPKTALGYLEQAHALRAAAGNARLLAETDLALARALADSRGDLGRARALVASAQSALQPADALHAEATALLARLTSARAAGPRAPDRKGSAP